MIHIVDVEQNALNRRLLRHRVGCQSAEIDGRGVVDRLDRHRNGKRSFQRGVAIVVHRVGKRVRLTRRTKVVQIRLIGNLLRIRADCRRAVCWLRHRSDGQMLRPGVRHKVYVVIRQHAEENGRIFVGCRGVVSVAGRIVHRSHGYGKAVGGGSALCIAYRQGDVSRAKLVGRGNNLHRAFRAGGVLRAADVRNDDVRQRNQRGIRRGLVDHKAVVVVLFVRHFKGEFARSVRRILEHARGIDDVRNRRRIVHRRNRYLNGRGGREPQLVLHFILEGFRAVALVRGLCGMGINELIVRNARRTIGRVQRGHHVSTCIQEAQQR